MKSILVATLFTLSAVTASAASNEPKADEVLRRAVGTCLVKQAVALDNGTKSVEILSRAVVAGCNPVITAHMVRYDDASGNGVVRALVGNADPVFGLDAMLTDRAASVIQWLRSAENNSVLKTRMTTLAAK